MHRCHLVVRTRSLSKSLLQVLVKVRISLSTAKAIGIMIDLLYH